MHSQTRALLVVPKFNPHSFWSYEGATEAMGAKYPTSPLGMITLAALLPRNWQPRLVNRNTEDLIEADLEWADLVMTGGMLSQQFDALQIIGLCGERKLPVVVGGPDVTSSPAIYDKADFQVLGEAQTIITDFIAAWERGDDQGVFEAEKFQADVTKSPIPRFDLLKFEQYLYIGVQFSRGCPFTCEFCDIIELYGRNPRAKTADQMLAELDCLRKLGYRGQVDFVDDNLIGNKKAVKAFLPRLIEWQKRHGYPFVFSTEASLNIAEDSALMTLMREAHFFAFFVGIESPDPDTLRHTSKKQNLKRNIAESIGRIYQHGMFVVPGFVLGFDTEKDGVADAILQCAEDAALPIGMFSLLYALPGTQLTRRLEKEGRLHPGVGLDRDRKQGDCTVTGLNFETRRPRVDILEDFAEILERMFEPKAYYARARRAMIPMRCVKLPVLAELRNSWGELRRFVGLMSEITFRRSDMRWHAWRLLAECAVRNPRAMRNATVMNVFFFYGAPLSRIRIAEVRKQIQDVNPAEKTASLSRRDYPPVVTA
jgi:radical SAM superfamily enzyme YgiQ (UPF0313 family)